MKDVRIPASKEQVLNPAIETVDAAENHGCPMEAQPVVDAGNVGPGHWEGNGPDVKFVLEN